MHWVLFVTKANGNTKPIISDKMLLRSRIWTLTSIVQNSGPKNGGNLLEFCSETKIWAEIFSKLCDLLAHSPLSVSEVLKLSGGRFSIEAGTQWLITAYFGICTCNCLHHVLCILFTAFPILVYGPSVCHCHLLKVGQMPTSNPVENPAGTLLFQNKDKCKIFVVILRLICVIVKKIPYQWLRS